MSTTYTVTEDTSLDFKDYGALEIAAVSRMLEFWLKDKWGKNARERFDTQSPPKIDLNKTSGVVYMIDEDYNTVIASSDKLLLWVTCPECGREGAEDNFAPGTECAVCVETKRSLL